jgi:general secretion pathway protein E
MAEPVSYSAFQEDETNHPDLVDIPSEIGTAQAVGCEACGHTGYQGRTGVFELLVTNDAIREQIHHRAAEAEIREAAITHGMVLMRDDGERLVRNGVTTMEELMRVTRD